MPELRASEGKPRSDFAVVVPAYDEAPNIPELARALEDAFRRHRLQGEVILVDDGSLDGTFEAAKAVEWDAMRVVRHQANLGKTAAILTAARSTRRKWLVVFDADLQHSPDEIPRFLDRLGQGWDIVTGRKIGAYDKKLVSGVYNRLSRWIFRVPVTDLNSMKGFRREILDHIRLRADWHRFFVVLAHRAGFSVSEIDIELYPRHAGEAKYSGKDRIVKGTLDLFSVWFQLRCGQRPMVIFGTLGAGATLLGGLLGVGAFYMRFAMEAGYRPLLYLIALLITVGALSFLGGFLAELVVALREEVLEVQRRLRLIEDRMRDERGDK